jgi:hypothetical protein
VERPVGFTDGGVSVESKEIYVPGNIRVDGCRLHESIPEVTMEIRGRINIKEPGLAFNDEQYNLVRGYINEFETVLFGANLADPDTGYAAYIDADSFVDWFLINEIAKNVDARSYSSIFLHLGDAWYLRLAQPCGVRHLRRRGHTP